MSGEVQQLGKYRILEKLGRGGFATVYCALDTTLEREVALKVLDPLLMRDEAWVERFRREAKAVAKLNHPHIVTIYEVDEADGRLFIAMELVPGLTLKDLIAERGCLSWGEMLDILAQVAEALDYAHGEGILHRDLKPGNILLDPRKGAMLTDFGFAKLVGESSMSVSVSGGIVGTPSYIAPEIWDGKEITVQTDLYALACIVYEMLTGEVLFGGETPMQVMRAHDHGPQFPEAWPAGVPGGLASVLRRALAEEVEKRHSTATALVIALRGIAQAKSASQLEYEHGSEPLVVSKPAESQAAPFSTTQSQVQQTKQRMRMPKWGWGLVAGLILMLLCLGVMFGSSLLGLDLVQREASVTHPPAVVSEMPVQVTPLVSLATSVPTVDSISTFTPIPTATPPPVSVTTPAPTPTMDPRVPARELVERFQEARAAAYGTWNVEGYYAVLTGDALESALQTIVELKRLDCQYHISDDAEMEFRYEGVSQNRVVVITSRSETQRRVCAGSTSYTCYVFEGRYVVEYTGDGWYIVEKSIQNLKEVAPCP